MSANETPGNFENLQPKPHKRKTPEKFSFTIKALEKLAPPSTGRVYYYDTLIRGLALCITANNARVYYLYRWLGTKPQRYRLGNYGELSIENARKMAAEKIGLIAQGIDPQQAKQEARGEPTFGDLFTAYLEKYKKTRRPKSWEQDQNNYDLHLSIWKNKRLSEITHELVAGFHTEIGGKHPYLANRLLSLISVIFNKARSVGIAFNGQNPAIGVARFEEKKREKYLNADAMPRFFKALDEIKNKTTADFFKVALYTGQRRSNVQAMRWDQVNLETGVWAIPDTKANRSHVAPLTAEVIEILQARKKESESDWVFPSTTSETGHLVEPKKAWKSVLEKAGLAGYRVHDLRHTLASWQAAQGTSLLIIGKGLGHSQASTTQRYAHVAIDPQRQAMGTATAAIKMAAETSGKTKPRKKKKPSPPETPKTN